MKQTNSKEVTKVTLKEMLEKHATISLRKLANCTNCCYQYILKASKKPIEGRVYNASDINYDEIEKIIRRKVAIEDIDFAQIESEVVVREAISELNDFDVNTIFTLRDKKEYTIVYKNEAFVVFISNDENDDKKPHVMNNDTFLHQGPRVK